MIKSIYKPAILLIISSIILLCSGSAVYAGNINSEEARVIAVASGTFTYKGKTYRAYSDYISELYSYLADDDTDLTAEQADSAISYIYSNVKEGIDSGYVYEVKSPSEKNNTDLDSIVNKDNGESDNKTNQSDGTEGSDKNLQDNQSDKSDEGNSSAKEASNREVEELFEKLDQSQEEREKNRHKASESDASIVINDDNITISTGDNDVKLYKDSRIIPESLINTLVIISACCLFIDIVLAIILISKGCMRFLKQERDKPKKGHRKRRKIRKRCRDIFTVTTAVAIILMYLSIAISIGIFNSDKIFQNIQSSGYFRYSYTEYIAQEKEGNAISYDDFVLKKKLAITSTLKKGNSSNPEDTSLAPYISRIQKDVKNGLLATVIISFVSIVLSVVLNIFMDLRRDRGIKSIAVSTSVGTFFGFIAAFVLYSLHIENRFFVEPGYLYNFLADQMDWIIKVFVIIGLFGIAIAASLFGLYKSMRKDRT